LAPSSCLTPRSARAASHQSSWVSCGGGVASHGQHHGLEASKLKTPLKRESGLIVQHFVPKMLLLKYELRREKHHTRETLAHFVTHPLQLVDRVSTKGIAILTKIPPPI